MSDDSNSKKVITTEQEKPAGLVLTTRENECLNQAMQGKNPLQIAAELNITTRTVYFYLNGVQVKLAVLLKQALVKVD